MAASTRYTTTAMVLHWIIAALILGNLVIVWTVGWLCRPLGPSRRQPPQIDRPHGPRAGAAADPLAESRTGRHRPSPAHPRHERVLAHAVHLILYAVILALPLSGYIHDSAFKLAATHPLKLYGLIPFPRIAPIVALPPDRKQLVHDQWFAIHRYLAYLLYALFVLHILGVLKHELIDRKPVLFPHALLPPRRREVSRPRRDLIRFTVMRHRVLLLHGIAAGSRSLRCLERMIASEGFETLNPRLSVLPDAALRSDRARSRGTHVDREPRRSDTYRNLFDGRASRPGLHHALSAAEPWPRGHARAAEWRQRNRGLVRQQCLVSNASSVRSAPS